MELVDRELVQEDQEEEGLEQIVEMEQQGPQILEAAVVAVL